VRERVKQTPLFVKDLPLTPEDLPQQREENFFNSPVLTCCSGQSSDEVALKLPLSTFTIMQSQALS